MTDSLVDAQGALDAKALRRLALDLGADDAGFVEIERPALADQLEDIRTALPGARALIALVFRIIPAGVQSPWRAAAQREFHAASDQASETTRRMLMALHDAGTRAVAESWGFPMEASGRWPGKMWFISHKPVAVEAGLGLMGTNRMILHPRFGGFVYFTTIAVSRPVSGYGRPIEKNPCDQCKLCHAVCPTGAIGKEGRFDFLSCITHNYRYKLGGFSSWVENVVESRGAADYRRRVSDQETVTMWQSLSHGSLSMCDYCVAVCPAGEANLPFYHHDKGAYVREVVQPLQERRETVYAVPGSDAEAYAAARFPHKQVKRVSPGIRPASVASFIWAMPLTFQPGRAAGLDAVYHLIFTGDEHHRVTVTIRNQTLETRPGLEGEPDLIMTADSATWLAFLAKEKSIAAALLTLKIRIKGDPRLLAAFGRCFPL
ncbi:MAG: SCP2 sterol-binding domain-containing protein [Nitrospinae bacterium]|nr:SCP2 sterol-binding domain-containing protein [Nitrospinota bacterium]